MVNKIQVRKSKSCTEGENNFLWFTILCGIIGDSAEQRGTETGATTG